MTNYTKLVAKWKKLIDTIDKEEFEVTFIDKLYIYKTSTPEPTLIDVKKLKNKNIGDAKELEYLIDIKITELKDQINGIDVLIDTEAVMDIAIPHVNDYLKVFD